MDWSGILEVDRLLDRQFLKPIPNTPPLQLEENLQAPTSEQQPGLEPRPKPPQVTIPCSPGQSYVKDPQYNTGVNHKQWHPQHTQKMKEGQVGLPMPCSTKWANNSMWQDQLETTRYQCRTSLSGMGCLGAY